MSEVVPTASPVRPPGRLHKPKSFEQKGVFTTGHVAKICRVSQQTIIGCFDRGEIGGFRLPLSNDRRILRVDLVRFMTDNNIPRDLLGSAAESPDSLLPDMSKDVFTTTEAAAIVDVSAKLIRDWIDKDILTGFLVPHSRFRRVMARTLFVFMRDKRMETPGFFALQKRFGSGNTVNVDEGCADYVL